MKVSNKIYLNSLALAALFFLFLFGLGRFSFLDYDEATYALVTSENLNTGNYLSFVHRGSPWIDKPPLYFWLAMVSAKIFGLNELALRLPSALLGITSVLLVFAIGRRLSDDRRIAYLAALVLALSGDFVFASRQMRLDIPVTAAILFSIYSFIRGWKNSLWYLGVGTGLAIGVMLKSVIGLLAAPVILILSFFYKRWDWLKNRWFWLSSILFLVLSLPWHIYEYKIYGRQFFNEYIIHSLFTRAAQPIIGAANSRFWYYPELLFKFSEPWFIVFLVLTIWFCVLIRTNFKEHPLPVAAFAATLLIFLFFNLSTTRLLYYLEPMYPFGVLFIASASIFIYEKAAHSFKRLLKIIFLCLVIAGLANTFWQGFGIKGGRSGEYALANEEKVIGKYLASQQFSNKVYTSNFYNYETIYYYGRGSQITLKPLKGDFDTDPFFLILPSAILQNFELDPRLMSRAEKVFDMPTLSMFKMTAPK